MNWAYVSKGSFVTSDFQSPPTGALKPFNPKTSKIAIPTAIYRRFVQGCGPESGPKSAFGAPLSPWVRVKERSEECFWHSGSLEVPTNTHVKGWGPKIRYVP